MHNRLDKDFKGSQKQYYGRPEKQLYHRLDAILLVTKGCKQDECRDPWGVLFPKNKVNGLEEAMKSKYDKFFESQPKIHFKSCKNGYIKAEEGPQHANPFGS